MLVHLRVVLFGVVLALAGWECEPPIDCRIPAVAEDFCEQQFGAGWIPMCFDDPPCLPGGECCAPDVQCNWDCVNEKLEDGDGGPANQAAEALLVCAPDAGS